LQIIEPVAAAQKAPIAFLPGVPGERDLSTVTLLGIETTPWQRLLPVQVYQ
jgi:hypothetical protein